MQGIGPGTTLGGRFTAGRRLSVQHGAERWTARDQTLDRPVILFVFPSNHPNAEAVLDAARRSAGLDNVRLSRILDMGRDGDVVYVVEEDTQTAYSLATLVSAGPLPAPEVRRIAGEAALVLDLARHRGLHHQRLTPDLVMRTADGDIKIVGLATIAALLGIEDIDDAEAAEIDTDSVVAIAYAGFTGRWPLPGDTGGLPSAPRVGAHVAAPSEIAAGVPADLDALCRLTFANKQGPSTPGDFARQIAPWSPIPVMLPSLTPRDASPVRDSSPGRDTSAGRDGSPGRDTSAGQAGSAPRQSSAAASRDASDSDADSTRVNPALAAGAAGTTAAVAAAAAGESDGGATRDGVRGADAGAAAAGGAAALGEGARPNTPGATHIGPDGTPVPVARRVPAPTSSDSPAPSVSSTPTDASRSDASLSDSPAGGPARAGAAGAGAGAGPAATGAQGAGVGAGAAVTGPGAAGSGAADAGGLGAMTAATSAALGGVSAATVSAAKQMSSRFSDWSAKTKERAQSTAADLRTKREEAAEARAERRAEKAAEAEERARLDAEARAERQALGDDAFGEEFGDDEFSDSGLGDSGFGERDDLRDSGAATHGRGAGRGEPSSHTSGSAVARTGAAGPVATRPQRPVADRDRLEPPVPLLPDVEPLDRDQSRMAIGIVVGFLVLALGFAMWILSRVDLPSFGGSEPSPTMITTPTDAAEGDGAGDGTQTDDGQAPPAESVALTFTGVQDYDPEGDGQERPEELPRILDGDPSTSWGSEGYSTVEFGGLKDGVGLIFDLGETSTISEVTLELVREAGGTVYVSDSELDRSQTPDGQATEAGTFSGTGTVTAELADGTSGRYIVVYFTDPTSDGSFYRVSVAGASATS